MFSHILNFDARKIFLAALLALSCASAALAQTTTFTYQGRLTDSGTPANGNYDLQFALFDSLSGGTQIGSTQTLSTVSISSGAFTVQLDFGAAAFPGANRFLEISVRLAGGGNFTTLSPRQQITSAPYAIRSESIVIATTQYNIDASSVLRTSPHGPTGADGNPIVGINAGITAGGIGSRNTFVGTTDAASPNKMGHDNSFFGLNAGGSNTTGSNNS